MSLRVLVLRYTLFAVLATLVNLAAQRLVFWAWPGTGRLVLAPKAVPWHPIGW